MSNKLTKDEKVNLFVKFYVDKDYDSNGDCAVAAGWSESRKHITASELLKDPEVQSKIEAYKKSKEIGERTQALKEESVQDIFETNLADMVRALKNEDPKKFLDMYFKFKKEEQEEEGEFHGLTLNELLKEVDNTNKEIEDIKRRIREGIQEGTLQE